MRYNDTNKLWLINISSISLVLLLQAVDISSGFKMIYNGDEGCQVIHKFNCKFYNDGSNSPDGYYQKVTGSCDLNSEAINEIRGQDCCKYDQLYLNCLKRFKSRICSTAPTLTSQPMQVYFDPRNCTDRFCTTPYITEVFYHNYGTPALYYSHRDIRRGLELSCDKNKTKWIERPEESRKDYWILILFIFGVSTVGTFWGCLIYRGSKDDVDETGPTTRRSNTYVTKDPVPHTVVSRISSSSHKTRQREEVPSCVSVVTQDPVPSNSESPVSTIGQPGSPRGLLRQRQEVPSYLSVMIQDTIPSLLESSVNQTSPPDQDTQYLCLGGPRAILRQEEELPSYDDFISQPPPEYETVR